MSSVAYSQTGPHSNSMTISPACSRNGFVTRPVRVSPTSLLVTPSVARRSVLSTQVSIWLSLIVLPLLRSAPQRDLANSPHDTNVSYRDWAESNRSRSYKVPMGSRRIRGIGLYNETFCWECWSRRLLRREGAALSLGVPPWRKNSVRIERVLEPLQGFSV